MVLGFFCLAYLEKSYLFKERKRFFGTLEKEDIVLKGSLAQFELTSFSYFSVVMIECEGLLQRAVLGHQRWRRDSPHL